MRLTILIIMTLALILTFLSSCSSQKLIPQRPEVIKPTKDIKREVSYIGLPVELKLTEVATLLNQLVPNQLYQGGTPTKGLSLNITRKGNIIVTAADGYIHFRIPTEATASYYLVNSPKIPLNFSFKTKISIMPDWKYNIETHYTGLYNLVFEEIGVGMLKVEPRKMVESALSPLQKLVSDLINKKINEKYSLKNKMATIWQNLYQPIAINGDFNTWLKIEPQQIILYPLKVTPEQIELSAGIKSYADLIVGPKPTKINPQPLPNITMMNNINRNFTLNMTAELFYADLVKIAGKTLINKEFNSGKNSIKIIGLDLYGNGDNLVVKAELKGAVDGLVYLTGQPKLDREKNLFYLDKVEFDILTESLLLKSAKWLLYGTIKETIANSLKIDLNQKMEEAKVLASKSIEKKKVLDKLSWSAKVEEIKINDLFISDDRIVIQIFAEGKSGLLVE